VNNARAHVTADPSNLPEFDFRESCMDINGCMVIGDKTLHFEWLGDSCPSFATLHKANDHSFFVSISVPISVPKPQDQKSKGQPTAKAMTLWTEYYDQNSMRSKNEVHMRVARAMRVIANRVNVFIVNMKRDKPDSQ
jgi:hypothetical protein